MRERRDVAIAYARRVLAAAQSTRRAPMVSGSTRLCAARRAPPVIAVAIGHSGAECYTWHVQEDAERDVRFGHDLNEIQDENGVDVSLLKANLTLSVEQRLLALEDFIRFAEAVAPIEAPRS